MSAARDKVLAAIEDRARAAAGRAAGSATRTPGGEELEALMFVTADRLAALAALAQRARSIPTAAPAAAMAAARRLAEQASLLSLAHGATCGDGGGPEALAIGDEIRRLAVDCRRLATTREF